MKKFLVVLIILIVIASVGWYIWTGRDGVRNYYQGYVQIEPVAMSVVIERLKKAGCTEQGGSCHYIFEKDKNTLIVNLFAKGLKPFGPGGSFEISNNKLYANIDIGGKQSLNLFKAAINDEIKRSGNVVTPIENTWTITKTEDRTGVVY